MTIDPNGKVKYTDIEVDPQLTFERFMRMPSNVLAHTAATGVAKCALENSPLCIFSEPGCGKTHLLNAIANQYRKNNPEKRVVLSSVESMIENYIAALQNSSLAELRAHYRTVDLLLIDDIEALSAAKQFQEELFNSLNALFQGRKLVVFASGQNPMRMKLPERLIGRITSGLTIKIEKFTEGESFEFLKWQFALSDISIADSAINLIVDVVHGNGAGLNRAVRAVKFVTAEDGCEATEANIRRALELSGIIK